MSSRFSTIKTLLGTELHNRVSRACREARIERALLGHVMRSIHRWRRVAHAHRPMEWPCAVVLGVHGCLGGLVGGPICEHCLLGGLAIRFVRGLGGNVLRFLDPKNLCGIYRCLYRQLGTETSIRTVRMDFPVPNCL